MIPGMFTRREFKHFWSLWVIAQVKIYYRVERVFAQNANFLAIRNRQKATKWCTSI